MSWPFLEPPPHTQCLCIGGSGAWEVLLGLPGDTMPGHHDSLFFTCPGSSTFHSCPIVGAGPVPLTVSPDTRYCMTQGGMRLAAPLCPSCPGTTLSWEPGNKRI
jgi:hypothetical protein